MFIELVELLRCTRAHEESWLVASIDELRDRSIIAGRLGCPVCSAEYPVVRGVADFSDGSPPTPGVDAEESDDEIGMRAGAFLALGSSAGVALLGGSWSAGAASLAAALEIRIIAANADGITESPGVGLVRMSGVIPLGAASCAGIALDDSFSQSAVASAVRALRPGGRLVISGAVELPAELTLVARDESWTVAEKVPELTTLRKGSR